ncbi:MAG: hypothetical protein D6771_09350, partial [Zetaproteobacteria bacterium]
MGLADAAIRWVIAHEGGYANDPRDPGGETKYGISKRSYPDLDIAALTIEDAIAIYRRDWWDRYDYDALADAADAAVAVRTFDLAVNMGAHAAHALLQRALADCGEPVRVDGIIGPQTLAACRRADRGWLYAHLLRRAMERYARLPHGVLIHALGQRLILWKKRGDQRFISPQDLAALELQGGSELSGLQGPRPIHERKPPHLHVARKIVQCCAHPRGDPRAH